VRNIAERLAVGNQPWTGMEKSRKGLGAAMKRLGYTPP
jgi:bifunctional non-homologous end joining protein LigD